jgi:hypothetical protein
MRFDRKALRTTMRTRQRLVRALITEIVVDIDAAAGEIVLVIHWKGGQHSELRVRGDLIRDGLADQRCAGIEQRLHSPGVSHGNRILASPVGVAATGWMPGNVER